MRASRISSVLPAVLGRGGLLLADEGVEHLDDELLFGSGQEGEHLELLLKADR